MHYWECIMSVNAREHKMTKHQKSVRLQCQKSVYEHNNKTHNSDKNIRITMFDHLYD